VLIFAAALRVMFMLFPIDPVLLPTVWWQDLLGTTLFENGGFPAQFVGWVIVVIQAFLVSNILNKQRALGLVNQVAAPFYLLVVHLIPAFHGVSAPMVSAIFLLLILREAMIAHRITYSLGNMINIGVFFGLMVLAWPPAVWFILWMFVAITILRGLRLDDFTYILLGFLGILVIFVAIMFWTLPINTIWSEYVAKHFGFPGRKYIQWRDIQLQIAIIALISIGLIGLFPSLSLRQRKDTAVQKLIGVIILTIPFAIAASLMHPIFHLSGLYIIAVPIGMLLGFSLGNGRKTLIEYVFFAMLIATILYQYYYSVVLSR
jgi:hypothetical protein